MMSCCHFSAVLQQLSLKVLCLLREEIVFIICDLTGTMYWCIYLCVWELESDQKKGVKGGD